MVYPCSQVISTSIIWLVAVCKYRGGNPGWFLVMCWKTEGRCMCGSAWQYKFLFYVEWSLVSWTMNSMDVALLTLWPPSPRTRKGFKIPPWVPSPCVYSLSTWPNHALTKSPRPSPSVFAYCKWSNTGCGNGLAMRLVHRYRNQIWSAGHVVQRKSSINFRCGSESVHMYISKTMSIG